MFNSLSNQKLGMIAAGMLVFVFILALIYTANRSDGTYSVVPVANNSFADTHQAIENFAAISQADYDKFKTAAQATDGLTEDKKKEILGLLGCQNAINQNMQGYRSAESGATLKVEEVKDIATGATKYIIHAADDLVLSADSVTGRLSRVVKNTKDPNQLFDKEDVINAGKAVGTFMFTKALTSGIKFGIQYEHEALSLRPLNNSDPAKPAVPFGRGQQFTYDANLKGDLLDAAAMALGYRLAPGIGSTDLQNAGGVAVCGAGSGAGVPITTKPSGGAGAAPNQSLCSLTEKQFNDAIAAAVANISAFNKSVGAAQPGTQNNSFANKPIRLNVNLGGLGGKSGIGTGSAPRGIISGFDDIPRSAVHESFADMASGSGTGQVRNLIQAWEVAQNPGPETDLGGFPADAGTLGSALRGKMVSCPRIDRTQYYTERQLAQCAGCTPDAYLRGQLGGSVFS